MSEDELEKYHSIFIQAWIFFKDCYRRAAKTTQDDQAFWSKACSLARGIGRKFDDSAFANKLVAIAIDEVGKLQKEKDDGQGM